MRTLGARGWSAAGVLLAVVVIASVVGRPSSREPSDRRIDGAARHASTLPSGTESLPRGPADPMACSHPLLPPVGSIAHYAITRDEEEYAEAIVRLDRCTASSCAFRLTGSGAFEGIDDSYARPCGEAGLADPWGVDTAISRRLAGLGLIVDLPVWPRTWNRLETIRGRMGFADPTEPSLTREYVVLGEEVVEGPAGPVTARRLEVTDTVENAVDGEALAGSIWLADHLGLVRSVLEGSAGRREMRLVRLDAP